MVAGCFEACGVWMGETVPGNAANPQGFFENAQLKSLLHSMLCMSEFNDSDYLPPFDFWNEEVARSLSHLVPRFFEGEGYVTGQPWAMKNPKIAFFWRLFERAFVDARWIVVRRDPMLVAESMCRVNPLTVPPKSRPLTKAALLQVTEAYDTRLQMILEAIPASRCWEVHSEPIAQGDFTELAQAIEGVGLTLEEQAVRAFVDPTLYHTQRDAR